MSGVSRSKAINFCSKSLEKNLANDLSLDLLVVLWLEKITKNIPQNGGHRLMVMNPMVENTHDLKQTKLVGGFKTLRKILVKLEIFPE